MMDALMRRAELLAASEQRRRLASLAERMREMLGRASVEIVDAKVVVSGRGLVRRWLTEPGLRFLASGFK
jgi:hypothetical protein